MALLKLLGLCCAMFIGAFVCGEIPLRCPMSPRRMKYLTTLGVGLLIGVSFMVIIPEGVHTYYGTKEIAQTNSLQFAAVNTTEIVLNQTQPLASNALNPSKQSTSATAAAPHDDHQHEHHEEANEHDHTHEGHSHSHSDGDEDGHDHAHGDHDHVHRECVDLNRSPTSVGLALISGFVVMFLVDRLGGAEEGHAHSHGGHTPQSLENLHKSDHHHNHHHSHRNHQHNHPHTPATGNHEARRSESPASSSATNAPSSLTLSPSVSMDECKQSLRINPASPRLEQPPPLPSPKFDQTATVGILVHSAIDGLALGAISVSDNSSLELVVFMAIILHKAPAAFGLTAFLLHQGRSQSEVRKHLLWFSLAAPLTSLATFIAFGYYNTLAGTNSLSASSPDGQALLGLCLLFSAGTFLFTIAVHILPEIQPSGNSSQSPAQAAQTTEWPMVACLIGGILGPLAFSGHSHGH